MAAPVWPSTLPQTFVRNTRQEEPLGQWLDSPMDMGPAKRRLRSVGTGSLQGQMAFDAVEWSTFLAFWETTLQYGTVAFYFPTSAEQLVRFTAKPQRQTRADVLFPVSIQLEVLP
jgi:hypothetical protein